ncbi:MAG: hypothetical protein QM687_05140 [Ferruginibacter sp.]
MKKYNSLIVFTAILIWFSCITTAVLANDTIRIIAKTIKTAQLKPGISQFLVYFKMKKEAPHSRMQIWTRTVAPDTCNGKKVYRVTQVWEDKDSVFHTAKSIVDAITMQPYYHEIWWKQRGVEIYDFVNKTASLKGMQLGDADTAVRKVQAWSAFKKALDTYSLNWHLDLEVFSVLPYKKGVTFIIPYYEPGATPPEDVAYTVTGEALLTGYNNEKIGCWLLSHESSGNKELFWISKKTKEVLKMEQLVNDSIYRYKIKLAVN